MVGAGDGGIAASADGVIVVVGAGDGGIAASAEL